MPGPIAEIFFCLCLIVDTGHRKILGCECLKREAAELVATLIQKAVRTEGNTLRSLVLHAYDASPMKGAFTNVTLERLSITAFCSRLRVSNDNPLCEAVFRTRKYCPDWPNKGFAIKACAQTWVKSFASWYCGPPPTTA